MGEPNVTTVIPAFNSSRTIERALRSVLFQTVATRVIIVDDNSRDDTISVIKRIIATFQPHQDVTLVQNKTNLGGAVSRNIGISMARTPLVALLDSDDEWDKKHLEKSLRQLEGADCDLVFNAVNALSGVPQYITSYSPLENIFVLGSVAQTSSYVFRKSELLFDEALRKHQDLDFLMTAYVSGKRLCPLSEITAIYHHDIQQNTRVSRQRRPGSSRQFYAKWRLKMSKDARISFYCWLYILNFPSISFRKFVKLFCLVSASRVSFSIKIRYLYKNIFKLVIR